MIYRPTRKQQALIDRLQATQDREEGRKLARQLFREGFRGECFSEGDGDTVRWHARPLDDGKPAPPLPGPADMVRTADGELVPLRCFKC